MRFISPVFLPMLYFAANLCLLNAKPQDLPATWARLTQAALAAFVSVLLLRFQFNSDFAVLISAIELGILAGELWVVTAWFKLHERWLQTTGSVFASMAMMNFVALPAAGMVQKTDGLPTPSLAMLFVMMASLWWFYIFMRIMREALGLQILRTFFLVLGLQLVRAFALMMLLLAFRTA